MNNKLLSWSISSWSQGPMRSVTSGARHAGIAPVGVALAEPTSVASFSDARGVIAGVCGYRARANALLHRASASRDRSANACGRVLACVDLYGIFKDLVEALLLSRLSKNRKKVCLLSDENWDRASQLQL